VAPDDVAQCEPHVGQCDVANLVDFWQVSKNREAESWMVLLRRTLRCSLCMLMGPFVGSSSVPLEKYRCNNG
jgi:hypothetical protein